MGLPDLLAQQKKSILKKWFDQVIRTYPPDTAQFLKERKDPFANPVGRAILTSLEEVFDALRDGKDRTVLMDAVDPIVRVRAVQAFTPSKAVAFIYFLKHILHEELSSRIEQDGRQAEYRAFMLRIDEAALAAFDRYVECREKLFELRVGEEKNRVYNAMVRAGLIAEIPDTTEDPGKDNAM